MQFESILQSFSQLSDPRFARGVRHPFGGIVGLVMLGMLARIREMEVLVRWATTHWSELKEPLGFPRDQPPCATTISRSLAQCKVKDFQSTLTCWLQHCLSEEPNQGVVAVDGKTARWRPTAAYAQRICAQLAGCRWPVVDRCRKDE